MRTFLNHAGDTFHSCCAGSRCSSRVFDGETGEKLIKLQCAQIRRKMQTESYEKIEKRI